MEQIQPTHLRLIVHPGDGFTIIRSWSKISSRPKHELLGPPNGGEKYREMGPPKNQGNGGGW